MNLFLTVKLAIRGLLANKMRAFLTVLGIIIGVSGIIIILSIGNGAESIIVNQVRSIGSNLVGILPGGRNEDEPPAAIFGIVVTTLKNEDILALKEIPYVRAVSGYNEKITQVVHKNRKSDASVNGVYHQYPDVEDAVIEHGRFFTEAENTGLARVVVLGSTIKNDLFGDGNSIGETIKINNQNFRVIGVFEYRGTSGFSNKDASVFIPSSTMQKLILGVNHVTLARVKVEDARYLDQTIEAIKNVLRTRHGITDPIDDDFTVSGMEQNISTLGQITGSIKLFLAAIAFVALIVGGVGVMNVMYVTVTERTHEIGLRKALGARRRDILNQFLVEAITITSIGGAIGIILGILTSLAVAVIVQQFGYLWDFIVTMNSIFYASVAVIIIGIVFGYAPAKKAASASAIEALRYE